MLQGLGEALKVNLADFAAVQQERGEGGAARRAVQAEFEFAAEGAGFNALQDLRVQELGALARGDADAEFHADAVGAQGVEVGAGEEGGGEEGGD